MASDHVRNIGPMQAAPKCQKIKQNGEKCRGMAVRGRRLCRSHGGKAGAPKGNQNALTDGLYTKKSRTRDQTARAALKQASALLTEIGITPFRHVISEKREQKQNTS